eukprot:28918-Alexandrium_andersonii.AAC.1
MIVSLHPPTFFKRFPPICPQSARAIVFGARWSVYRDGRRLLQVGLDVLAVVDAHVGLDVADAAVVHAVGVSGRVSDVALCEH